MKKALSVLLFIIVTADAARPRRRGDRVDRRDVCYWHKADICHSLIASMMKIKMWQNPSLLQSFFARIDGQGEW